MTVQKLYYSYKNHSHGKDGNLILPVNAIKLLSSVLLSFLWVGMYQYKYNIEAFNTNGINIWAFSLWVTGGYATLNLQSRVKRIISIRYRGYLVSWILYFAGLLVIEYIGYNILCIRESSAKPDDALLLGLVHGTFILHTYYVIFPFLILFVYHFILSLFVYGHRQRPKLDNELIKSA